MIAIRTRRADIKPNWVNRFDSQIFSSVNSFKFRNDVAFRKQDGGRGGKLWSENLRAAETTDCPTGLISTGCAQLLYSKSTTWPTPGENRQEWRAPSINLRPEALADSERPGRRVCMCESPKTSMVPVGFSTSSGARKFPSFEILGTLSRHTSGAGGMQEDITGTNLCQERRFLMTLQPA